MSKLTHDMRNHIAPLQTSIVLLRRQIKPHMSEVDVAAVHLLLEIQERSIKGMKATLLKMEGAADD